MRNDELYGNAPRSEQAQLEGIGEPGEALVAEARAWIAANPNAWDYMVNEALRLSASGYVSINGITYTTRCVMRVSIKNALAPAFARIMQQEQPVLSGKFRMHASKADGFA